MTNKYFIREKCMNLHKFPNWHTNPDGFYDCPICHKEGFIKGADVTEHYREVFGEIDNFLKMKPKDEGDVGFIEGLKKAKEIILKGLIVEKETLEEHDKHCGCGER